MQKKNKTKGLALCFAVALAAFAINRVWPTPGDVTLAILIGLFIGNLLGKGREPFLGGVHFAEKRLLPTAVALMGFSVYFSQIMSLSVPGVVIVVTTMATAILSALTLGRIFGLRREFSLLIGTGNAVCGSSAIAAMSKVLDVDENETGMSISLVNLCGILGIVLMPLTAKLLEFSPIQSGELTGASLQAVGQVAAAGFAQGENTGSTALIVKMARVLMLGPVILFFALLFKHETRGQKHTPWYKHIPLFIVIFFVFALINSAVPLPGSVKMTAKIMSKVLMLVSMAGIGFKIHTGALLKQGPRALSVCFVGWIIQISVLCVVIGFLS